MQVQNTKGNINKGQEKWILGWSTKIATYDTRYGKISKIRCSYIESYYSDTEITEDGEVLYTIYMNTVSKGQYRTKQLDQSKYYEYCSLIEGE